MSGYLWSWLAEFLKTRELPSHFIGDVTNFISSLHYNSLSYYYVTRGYQCDFMNQSNGKSKQMWTSVIKVIIGNHRNMFFLWHLYPTAVVEHSSSRSVGRKKKRESRNLRSCHVVIGTEKGIIKCSRGLQKKKRKRKRINRKGKVVRRTTCVAVKKCRFNQQRVTFPLGHVL